MNTETKKQEQHRLYLESIEFLINIFKKDNKVYTVLNHVSSSGMTRHISLFVARGDEIVNITWRAGKVLGLKRSPKTGGLIVSGCGMDMGFLTVYNLSSALYPSGFKCLGEKCTSNDHSNDSNYDRVKDKHNHKSGGYCLDQIWL